MAFIANLIYGIISIVGGIIGYKQSQSKISLISGSISGLLLLIASYFINQGLSWSLLMGAIVCFTLVIVFILRLKKTGKFMPAGLMIILGTIAFLITVAEYLG